MSAVEALPTQLPYLRRFARALTGSQALGDGYALAALEAAVADPVGTYDGPDPGVVLYRAAAEDLDLGGQTPDGGLGFGGRSRPGSRQPPA